MDRYSMKDSLNRYIREGDRVLYWNKGTQKKGTVSYITSCVGENTAFCVMDNGDIAYPNEIKILER